jgi:hypothetical protein
VTARVGVPRLAGVALVISAIALATACGSGVAGEAVDQAATDLAQQVVRGHERTLSERAADPTAVDAAAADRLGIAITGGNANVVSATATSDAVEVVSTAGVRVEVGGGLFYEQTTLGACLLTRATPGSPTGGIGERGIVTTEAAPCAAGVVPVVDSAPVEATTTQVEVLRGPVPRPVSPLCLSGSDDCEGGGG